MKTCTIGYIREDGDLAILATLNNNDEHFSDGEFECLAKLLILQLELAVHEDLLILERQDAPDYITLET
jgi:hypothetical protein